TAVARFLQEHSQVSWVNYPSLPGSPYYELARKYLPKGVGAIMTFGIKGGQGAGVRFIEAAQFMSHLANVGDAKTLVIHPASTTHRQLSEEEQIKAGVTPDMIRLSIGIEDIDDILWDLDQALQKSQEASPITQAPPMVGADEFEPSGHSLLSKAFGAPYQR